MNYELCQYHPIKDGWYPTVTCWDIHEGGFPGAHYWEGDRWKDARLHSIQYIDLIFQTKEEAITFARENDLGW